MIEAVTLDGVPVPTEAADRVMDALVDAGAEPVMVLASGRLDNGFPALPVRNGPTVTWLTRFASDEAYRAYRDTVRLYQTLATAVRPAVLDVDRVRRLVLRPTASSRLR